MGKKINNDVLIPRSILKRNNPGNLIKDKRLEEATRDYFNYQEEMKDLKDKKRAATCGVGNRNSHFTNLVEEEEYIGKYDALFGKNIKQSNPLLSPKISAIV